MTDTRPDRFEAAIEGSAAARAVRRVRGSLARWAGGSRLVRWFLAEPDPEVVVIDLRETYTVGPLLRANAAVLEGATAVTERTGVSSTAAAVAGRIEARPLRAAGTAIVLTALLGIAAAVLGGPEPTWTANARSGAVGGWLLLLGLGLLATRERRSAAELAETRVGRAVRAAFAPPEPPRER